MRYVWRTWSGKSRGSARRNRSKSRSSRARTLAGEACQAELGLGRRLVQHEPRHELTDGGPVLEAVSRAAAHEPGVRGVRVAVDDEVLVRRVLVLAHARFEQRRARQRGEPEAEIVPGRLEGGGRGEAVVAGGLKPRAPGIVRDP